MDDHDGYFEWVDEVDAELEAAGEEPTGRAKSWLYSAAYYDGFEVADACEMALNPEMKFKRRRVRGLTTWITVSTPVLPTTEG